MKFLFLWLVAVVSVNTLFAQKQVTKPNSRPDTLAYYMRTDNLMADGEQDAQFVRLLIKIDSGMIGVKDYFMDGKVRLIAKTSVDNIVYEGGAQGISYEYFANGKRKSIKNYNNGKVVGDALEYYPNGGLYSIINYSANGTYLKQCLDSAGAELATNGNGKWLKIEDGLNNYMEGRITNGKEDGEWKRHYADSIYTIVYKQGKVVAGAENLNAGKQIYEKVDVLPSFPGGDVAFGKFLSKNVIYPKVARDNNIQGRVVITFVVERDGTLTNIRVTNSIGSGMDQEALRVIVLSPRWNPGLLHGKPVRVQFSVPVNFALSND